MFGRKKLLRRIEELKQFNESILCAHEDHLYRERLNRETLMQMNATIVSQAKTIHSLKQALHDQNKKED